MSLMYESGVNDAWQKLGFSAGSVIDAMHPATYRRLASPIGGAIGGAALGAATGEEGTRGRRALMGGALGAAGSAALNEGAELIRKIPAQHVPDKAVDMMFSRKTPLMGAAIGAGIGAGTADEGHGLRGGVIGGVVGGSLGGLPRRAIDNVATDEAWAALRAAGKTASASPLGQLLHAAHLGKNGITPDSPLMREIPRPFEGPRAATQSLMSRAG